VTKIISSDHVSPGLVVCLINRQVVWFGPVAALPAEEAVDTIHCAEGEREAVLQALAASIERAAEVAQLKRRRPAG
jgi:hypothetical protein